MGWKVDGTARVANTGAAGQTAATPPPSAHVQLLKTQISKLDGELKTAGGWNAGAKEKRELRADLAAELGRVETALAGKTQLPPQTKAKVDELTRGLGAEEKAIVTAKAAELVEAGVGLEQTGGPRFAANMALELSEYAATGAKLSPGLQAGIGALVNDAASVFAAKPQLRTDFQQNMSYFAKLNAR